MTDDQKLALLDEYETVYWESLQSGEPIGHIESYNLKSIERCQRIRASLEIGVPQDTVKPRI